ncbi:MAG: signal recognition particle-docking protein FtsY [Rickettsiaceae bacterium]|nr:MAG: signal recognition particle-docking protein FtsY [Rickettsiaceae bacterium]
MSLLTKLKQAFVNTSSKISVGIDSIFAKKKPANEVLEELEELLISADISSSVAEILIKPLKSLKLDKNLELSNQADYIKQQLVSSIVKIFNQNTKAINILDNRLNIILVCGVNGNGKTTTIGKLAARYKLEGKKVAVAACDTFRAAAVEQLEKWANVAEVMIFTGAQKADPASVAYNAIKKSQENNIDILFIDTAGRLHNHKNLMDELYKIVKTVKKNDDTAPHQTMLVLDATTGQNAYSQVEQFKKAAEIDGLILTKLDGTAKAGVIVGIVEQFSLPVYFIGVGEKIEDLQEFDSTSFAQAIFNE